MVSSVNFLQGLTVGVSGFTVVVNLTLAATILFSKQTRIAREYVLIVGTVIMDTIFNLAYLFSGIVQIAAKERPSRLSCGIQAFPCIFFVTGTPLIGFSVVLIATDRFYAVIKPARYYKSDAKQAWIGVALTFFISLFVLLVFVILTAIGPSKCVLGFDGVFAMMPVLRYMRIASIGSAIFLYAAIYAYMWSNHEKVAKKLGQQHAMNRMISILKTAVIAVMPSAVCIFIPDICLSFGIFVKYTDWLNFMIMFKGAINIFIYTLRHRDLRKSVGLLLFCKTPFNRNTKVTIFKSRSPVNSSGTKENSHMSSHL